MVNASVCLETSLLFIFIKFFKKQLGYCRKCIKMIVFIALCMSFVFGPTACYVTIVIRLNCDGSTTTLQLSPDQEVN